MTTDRNAPAIDPATLRRWLDRDQVLLIDVREPGEFAGAHIPGARPLPLSRFRADDLPPANGRQVVLVCASGHRARQAAARIAEAGDRTVYVLDGGLEAWRGAGFPLAVTRNAPISLVRQVQIVVGAVLLVATALGALVDPGFFALAGAVGAGLLYAGVTGSCLLANLIGRLPYNQRQGGPAAAPQPADKRAAA